MSRPQRRPYRPRRSRALAYGLDLVALSLAPVSSVAAAREVSVVTAAVLGRWVLREPYVVAVNGASEASHRPAQ